MRLGLSVGKEACEPQCDNVRLCRFRRGQQTVISEMEAETVREAKVNGTGNDGNVKGMTRDRDDKETE